MLDWPEKTSNNESIKISRIDRRGVTGWPEPECARVLFPKSVRKMSNTLAGLAIEDMNVVQLVVLA